MTAIREVNPFISEYRFWSAWLLVLLVFASHRLLMINDSVYWGAWQLFGYYLNQDSESLLCIFSDVGHSLTGYSHSIFWTASNTKFAYKLISFISILFSMVFVLSTSE
jgi:hypothetical protein